MKCSSFRFFRETRYYRFPIICLIICFLSICSFGTLYYWHEKNFRKSHITQTYNLSANPAISGVRYLGTDKRRNLEVWEISYNEDNLARVKEEGASELYIELNELNFANKLINEDLTGKIQVYERLSYFYFAYISAKQKRIFIMHQGGLWIQ